MKQWFYGIRGIQFISHGEWADPELIWHGRSFNYYDIEMPLWEVYREECDERGERPDEIIFETWVKKNAYLAREYLQNLLDNKCFYGGQLMPF
ncbi:hypothetical protein [Succinimonas sp.]|uniref:hypothetical protein n=1 Tax=Succinimonas sp. TaxID=1936151 RepID=UPI0038639709